jgi:hypothetical protein
VTRRQVAALGPLGALGFTLALFITELAYAPDPDRPRQARHPRRLGYRGSRLRSLHAPIIQACRADSPRPDALRLLESLFWQHEPADHVKVVTMPNGATDHFGPALFALSGPADWWRRAPVWRKDAHSSVDVS